MTHSHMSVPPDGCCRCKYCQRHSMVESKKQTHNWECTIPAASFTTRVRPEWIGVFLHSFFSNKIIVYTQLDEIILHVWRIIVTTNNCAKTREKKGQHNKNKLPVKKNHINKNKINRYREEKRKYNLIITRPLCLFFFSVDFVSFHLIFI